MSETMHQLMTKLTAPIPPDEIELRIGQISHPKGFSLLAYKNSRIDVNRLNTVFGARWKNKYKYDTKNNLVCGISIYDHELQQWVTRWDVGNPTQGEHASKGEHSDSLKRAGFRWGIGTELYDMPFLWISLSESDFIKGKNGKFYPKCQYKIRDWRLSLVDGYYIIADETGKNVCRAKSGASVKHPEKEIETEPPEKNTKEPMPQDPNKPIETPLIRKLNGLAKVYMTNNMQSLRGHSADFLLDCYNARFGTAITDPVRMTHVNGGILESGYKDVKTSKPAERFFAKQLELYLKKFDNEAKDKK